MSIENSVPTDPERQMAADVAHRAMISGWKQAINDVGAKEGLHPWVIENILNKVSADQPQRDSAMKIEELRGWEDYRRSRVDISAKALRAAKTSNIHKLSPGLRKFMLKKHPHLGLTQHPGHKASQSKSGP